MIKIFKSLEQISTQAAASLVDLARESFKERGRFLLVLSGGNTPMHLYELLATEDYRNQLDWSKVHFFWGDERCVPINRAENSYGQANSVWLNTLNLPAENIHRIESELDPQEAASRYATMLEAFSDPPLRWPRFDLVLLGLGEDGHTASLFPNSPVEMNAPTIAVTANYQGRPAKRVTMTPLIFNSARNILFLVTGKNKAQTLFNILKGEPKPEVYPAQRISPHDGNLTWLLDEEAASLL